MLRATDEPPQLPPEGWGRCNLINLFASHHGCDSSAPPIACTLLTTVIVIDLFPESNYGVARRCPRDELRQESCVAASAARSWCILAKKAGPGSRKWTDRRPSLAHDSSLFDSKAARSILPLGAAPLSRRYETARSPHAGQMRGDPCSPAW